jgi:hypothetical protein
MEDEIIAHDNEARTHGGCCESDLCGGCGYEDCECPARSDGRPDVAAYDHRSPMRSFLIPEETPWIDDLGKTIEVLQDRIVSLTTQVEREREKRDALQAQLEAAEREIALLEDLSNTLWDLRVEGK